MKSSDQMADLLSNRPFCSNILMISSEHKISRWLIWQIKLASHYGSFPDFYRWIVMHWTSFTPNLNNLLYLKNFPQANFQNPKIWQKICLFWFASRRRLVGSACQKKRSKQKIVWGKFFEIWKFLKFCVKVVQCINIHL